MANWDGFRIVPVQRGAVLQRGRVVAPAVECDVRERLLRQLYNLS